ISPRWSVARRAFPFSLGTRASRTKTPRAGHGAQIRVPRRHSCARRRSPPPRGVEKEMMFGDVPKEKGEEEDEDEVGDRETDRTKIAVERRGPARARAKPENNNHRAAGPGVSPRSTQPTALRYGGALFAGLFDIVNPKSAGHLHDCGPSARPASACDWRGPPTPQICSPH